MKHYIELTKPRITWLILMSTGVGYFFGLNRGTPLNWSLLIHTLVGTGLIASGTAALNQWWERESDALMRRTASRPLPMGLLTAKRALWFGIGLAVAGAVELALWVNVLSAILGAITLAAYLFVYTPMKRLTTLNTVIGAIAGAIPPVMGWTAVHNSLGREAAVLFCILFFWQMPHFLAIAILYRRDYEAGGFKMLPVVDRDLFVTGRQIVLYNAALIPITLMPTLFRMTGTVYFIAAMVLGLAYLSFGIICAATRQRADARKLFFCSIIYLPLLLAVMMLDKL